MKRLLICVLMGLASLVCVSFMLALELRHQHEAALLCGGIGVGTALGSFIGAISVKVKEPRGMFAQPSDVQEGRDDK